MNLKKEASQEIEIKFAIAEADVETVARRIEGLGKPCKRSNLRSVYFDTADDVLSRRKASLRIRFAGGEPNMMCCKMQTPGKRNVFKRSETETTIAANAPDISLFDPKTARTISEMLNSAELHSRFETNVDRMTTIITHGQSMIEIALDRGQVRSDEKLSPLTEVELELLSGDEADFYDYARQMVRELPLHIDTMSKSQKGFALATGMAVGPVKSAPPVFDMHGDVDNAISAVLGSTLAHFTANLGRLRDDADAKTVHQFRVSLRRMRSALKIFARLLPCPAFAAMRAQAAEIATLFGPVRELDVLAEAVSGSPLAKQSSQVTLVPLLTAISDSRNKALEQAMRVIQSRQASLFALQMHKFLATHDWRHSLTSQELADLTKPAKPVICRALTQLHHKVRKRGKHFSKMDEAARHRLRIALKDLRYATEFFAALFRAFQPIDHGWLNFRR